MRSEEVEVGGNEMSSRLLDGVLRPNSDFGMESLDYEVVESAASRRREAEARGGAGNGCSCGKIPTTVTKELIVF